MDLGQIRGILTAIIFVAFIGICIWAYSSRRKADFDASAALPLEDDVEMTDKRESN